MLREKIWFAALVVVGNQKGSIGIGQGKSKQVPDAIKFDVAKRNLIQIPLKEGRTHMMLKVKRSGKVLRSALQELNNCRWGN